MGLRAFFLLQLGRGTRLLPSPPVATTHYVPGSLAVGRMWSPQLPTSLLLLPTAASALLKRSFFFFFFLLIPLGETDVGGEGGEHTHTHLSPEVPQVPDSLLRCVGHWRPQLPPRHPPTHPTPLHCAPAFPLVDKPPSSPNSLLGKTSCLRPKFLVLDQLTAKQCG